MTTTAHDRTFSLRTGKTGASLAHLVRGNPTDERGHADQDAPDARGNCGIHRHHSRNGYAYPERFQSAASGFHPGIDADDSKSRRSRKFCRGLETENQPGRAVEW